MIKDDTPVSRGAIARFTAWGRRHPIKAVMAMILSIILAITVLFVAFLTVKYMQLGSFKNMMEGIPTTLGDSTGDH